MNLLERAVEHLGTDPGIRSRDESVESVESEGSTRDEFDNGYRRNVHEKSCGRLDDDRCAFAGYHIFAQSKCDGEFNCGL